MWNDFVAAYCPFRNFHCFKDLIIIDATQSFKLLFFQGFKFILNINIGTSATNLLLFLYAFIVL